MRFVIFEQAHQGVSFIKEEETHTLLKGHRVYEYDDKE